MSDAVRRACDSLRRWLNPLSGFVLPLLFMLAMVFAAPPVLYVYSLWIRWWLP